MYFGFVKFIETETQAGGEVVPVLTVLSRHLVRHGAAEESDARELAGAQQVLGRVEDEVTVDARRPR